jgi:hypothetical protein
MGNQRILPCVRRLRLHYISAWATIFRGHSFSRGEDQSSTAERLADRSELTGIMQGHKETTVSAGHGSPGRYRRSDSPVGYIWVALLCDQSGLARSHNSSSTFGNRYGPVPERGIITATG